MSKRLTVLMMLACLPLAAGAAEPTPTETAATETAATATETGTPAIAEVAKKPALCEKVTGSRVRPSARDCATTKPFRTYTAEDLERTGEMNLLEALRKLDPIFR